MKRISLVIGTVALLTTPATAIAATPTVEAVVSHLVGVMDTSAQAAANPDKANVRMTTCRVQMVDAADSNSVFLYQEQALGDRLNQPYRQRFLQISANGQTVVSQSYKPQNPQDWINSCNQSAPQLVKSEDLGESVCSVYLKPLIAVYVGNTPTSGCPANVRGAVKITNTIVLHADGMDTYDRGFDAAGNQVWGANDESYQFRWVKNSNSSVAQ